MCQGPKVFGTAIADFKGVWWKLCEMYETSRSILYHACISANRFPDPFMAAMTKITFFSKVADWPLRILVVFGLSAPLQHRPHVWTAPSWQELS